MNLVKLLSLDPEHTLTADECQLLNHDLSLKSFTDIPVNARNQIEDYLTMALNMNSVEGNIKSKLDDLLVQLQNV